MTTAEALLHHHIDAFKTERRVKAGSVIVTAFGDAIAPRGGVLWLGSLIQLLAPLGINERLVRTAAFRLVKEDWLVAHAAGRRTNYALSVNGRIRIQEASRHIYAISAPQWDGAWRLLALLGEVNGPTREALRRALYWQGFGELNGPVFVHPSADWGAVFDALTQEGLQDTVSALVPFTAQTPDVLGAGTARDVVHRAWDLQQLGLDYAAFVRVYRPIENALNQVGHSLQPALAFQLRLLLLHDFRRLLLRDPLLPEALLPEQWPGVEARTLCRAVYKCLWEASERYLADTLQLADGAPLQHAAQVPGPMAAWLL